MYIYKAIIFLIKSSLVGNVAAHFNVYKYGNSFSEIAIVKLYQKQNFYQQKT